MEVIRLPSVRERPTKPISMPVQNQTNHVRAGFEPASISSTPPSEFLSILKNRLSIYYSIPSTDNKNK